VKVVDLGHGTNSAPPCATDARGALRQQVRTPHDRGYPGPYPRPVEILGTRAKVQPPPSHVLFEALMSPNSDPARQWLQLLNDEVLPEVTESARPTLVLWSSIWVKRPEAQIRFDIEGDGPGCHLRWTLLDTADPGPALLGHMCKRLNMLINAELRYSFGQ
jgi:hypothetical protein